MHVQKYIYAYIRVGGAGTKRPSLQADMKGGPPPSSAARRGTGGVRWPAFPVYEPTIYYYIIYYLIPFLPTDLTILA